MPTWAREPQFCTRFCRTFLRTLLTRVLRTIVLSMVQVLHAYADSRNQIFQKKRTGQISLETPSPVVCIILPRRMLTHADAHTRAHRIHTGKRRKSQGHRQFPDKATGKKRRRSYCGSRRKRVLANNSTIKYSVHIHGNSIYCDADTARVTLPISLPTWIQNATPSDIRLNMSRKYHALWSLIWTILTSFHLLTKQFHKKRQIRYRLVRLVTVGVAYFRE